MEIMYIEYNVLLTVLVLDIGIQIYTFWLIYLLCLVSFFNLWTSVKVNDENLENCNKLCLIDCDLKSKWNLALAQTDLITLTAFVKHPVYSKIQMQYSWKKYKIFSIKGNKTLLFWFHS